MRVVTWHAGSVQLCKAMAGGAAGTDTSGPRVARPSTGVAWEFLLKGHGGTGGDESAWHHRVNNTL